MTDAFTELTREVVVSVPGCLDEIAAMQVRRAVIDLCERARVWQATLSGAYGNANSPLPTDQGDQAPFRRVAFSALDVYRSAYGDPPADPNDAMATMEQRFARVNASVRPLVHSVEWMRLKHQTQHRLEARSFNGLENARQKRLVDRNGDPFFFAHETPSTRDNAVYLWPADEGLPDGETVAYDARLVLKPSRASLGVQDGRLIEEYYETLVEGAIYRLLAMPGEVWSSLRRSQAYYVRYQDGVMRARSRVKNDEAAPIRTVQYGGIGAGSIYNVNTNRSQTVFGFDQ